MKTAALIILAAAGIAHAGDASSITQTLDYSWNANDGFQIGTLDGFDDAGGTRELTGVAFDISGSLAVDVEALNFSSFALEGGEWSAEGIVNANLLFGDFGPGGVERIAGAVSFSGLTGELGAGSGSPFGPAGSPTVTDSLLGGLSGSFTADTDEFAAFTSGPVSANLLAFSDFIVTAPVPGSIISVNANSISSEGAVNLTYLYNVVPAPTTAGLLGLGGLLLARRRR